MQQRRFAYMWITYISTTFIWYITWNSFNPPWQVHRHFVKIVHQYGKYCCLEYLKLFLQQRVNHIVHAWRKQSICAEEIFTSIHKNVNVTLLVFQIASYLIGRLLLSQCWLFLSYAFSHRFPSPYVSFDQCFWQYK